MTVLAAHRWKNNAEMIADVAKLGYLDGEVLDCTYGFGGFWKVWRPERLTASDLHTGDGVHVFRDDFTMMPWRDGGFDSVVFDPPYKLKGTSTDDVDECYGIDDYMTPDDRHQLIRDGLDECLRVTSDHLLVKVMDQVCNGQMYWQTDIVCDHIGDRAKKVDRFDLIGHARKQPMFGRRKRDFIGPPKPRRQLHAYGRGSTLLVFKKGKA
jgi:hypothetical protein